MGNSQKRCITLIFTLLLTQVVAADQNMGEAVYAKWCDGCHMNSPFAPGTIQLRSLRGADLALLKNRRDLSADYIRHIVRKGRNGMPLFRRTEISAEQLDALLEYLLSEK